MITELPQYAFARAAGRVPPLPFNFTLAMTGECNSRCLTCLIRHREQPDLTLEEWGRIAASIGTSPFWLTLTGGNQFLRADLPAVHATLVEITKPSIVNVPLNSLSKRDIPFISEMANGFPKTKLIINISIDHCDPAKNDVIRGVPGHFKRAIANFEALSAMSKERPNLTVGIHTVISRFNVRDFPEIADYFLGLAPGQFISEIAENRVEMNNLDKDITPSQEDYAFAINHLRQRIEHERWSGLSNVTRSFRLTYYANVLKHLETGKQAIPCYAGYASCQINPWGQVWPCCIEAVPLGNLRENDYDFPAIWRGGLARQARERIRSGGCACPLANSHYSSVLMNPGSLVQVAGHMVGA